MAVYGYDHWFSGFRRLLETDESGFAYEGRRYAWSDVEKVDRIHRSFITNLAVLLVGPVALTAHVHLEDGSWIELHGTRPAREGETPRLGFLGGFRGESEAYRELVRLIESKLQASGGSARQAGGA